MFSQFSRMIGMFGLKIFLKSFCVPSIAIEISLPERDNSFASVTITFSAPPKPRSYVRKQTEPFLILSFNNLTF